MEFSRLYGSGTVLAVLSVPGREGTVSRKWDGRDGLCPDAYAVEDIVAWTAQAVRDWLVTVEGVQERLAGV